MPPRTAAALSTLPNRPLFHAASLFLLNLAIFLPWLGVEWLDRMDSIEGAFIGIARHRFENPGATGWFPFWYLGIPFEITYPPLVPALAALTAWVANLSPARGYHLLTGLLYALGPASLYWLLRRLGAGPARALAGGLAYSLLAPSALLMPSIAADLGSIWLVRRFHNLAVYGEGPHVVALTLLFVALVLLDRALERPTALRLFLAAAGVALVPLTNWLGAFALAWGALAITMASTKPLRSIPTAALVGIWAYGLAVMWLPPSVIGTVQWNSQADSASGPMGPVRLAALLAAIVLVSALAWELGRRGVAKSWRFLLVFAPPFAVLPLLEEHLRVVLVPRSLRYHLELEVAVVIAAVFLLSPLMARMPVRLRHAAAALCLVLAVVQAVHLHGWAKSQSRPVAIESTIEYSIARELAGNHPGKRLFSVGTVRYWLAAFADVPQFGGSFKHGVGFPQWWVIDYGIHFIEDEAEILVDWLRAYGIDILYVGEDGTREHIKPLPDAEKFRGVLPEVFRDGADVLYRIPRRGGLAHLVPATALVDRTPYNILDVEPMRRYVAALEDSGAPGAVLTWHGPDHALIEASPRPGDVVSVQIIHHPRWKASSSGVPLATRADELGLLVIEPRSPGATRIELTYQHPRWILVLWIAAWGLGLAFVLTRSLPLLKLAP